MAIKLLRPETVYLPTKGINPDGNGISLRPEECVNATNIRFSPQDLEVRKGSRQLASSTPSGDPMLHFHTYKSPTGAEVLFGFTKNTIHKFTPGTDGAPGSWVAAMANTQVENCNSATGWATAAPNGVVSLDTTNKVQGTGSIKVVSTGDVSDTTIILKRTSISDALDLRAHKSLYFYYTFYPTAGGVDLPVQLKLYTSTDCSGGVLDTLAFVLTANSPLGQTVFKQVLANYASAGSLSDVNSFSISAAEAYSGHTGFTFRIDDVVSVFSAGTADLTFWDTADIIDETHGATVVAAGSKPPNPNVAESDGASRVLYYLNPTSSLFADLDIKHKVSVSSDFGWDVVSPSGKVVATTTGATLTIKGTKESDHSGNIVAGLFYLTTDRGGTIATASALKQTVSVGSSDADGYALLGSDPSDAVAENVTAATGSWVKEDGTFQLNFKPSSMNGYVANENIYLNYTYTESSDIKPRFVRGFHNRLILGNIYDATDGVSKPYYPWRIMWTDIQDMDDMSALAYQDIVGADITPITRMEHLGYYLFIYKYDSKARIRHVGGASTFLSETIEKRGCKAGRTVVSFRGLHFYLGEDDVYVFDGTNSFSITMDEGSGNHRVRDTLFRLLSNEKTNSHFGSMLEKHNEYWLWFTRSTNIDTEIDAIETNPSMVLVYNAQLKIFYFFEFKNTTAVGYYQSTSGPTWDDLTRTWESSGLTWKSGDSAGTPKALVLARQNSDTYLSDGTDGKDYSYGDDATFVAGDDIAYSLITRDFIWGDISRKVRTTKVNFECNGKTDTKISYVLDYSTDIDVFKVEESIPIDYNSKELTYFPDATGEHIRFLFTGTEAFRLRWLQPHGIVHDLPGE